jgi:hypothetical protein
MFENLRLKELSLSNPIALKNPKVLSQYLQSCSFDKFYDLYSAQPVNKTNSLDDDDLINLILDGEDNGKKLVIAMFASNSFFSGWASQETLSNLVTISPAHKIGLFSNTRMNWYSLGGWKSDKEKLDIIQEYLLGDDNDAVAAIVQNPRIDRTVIADAISAKNHFSSLSPIRRLELGSLAILAKEIKSEHYIGQDSPDFNELYFDKPFSSYLKTVRELSYDHYNDDWFKWKFTTSEINAYLNLYSLRPDYNEWLTQEQLKELDTITDWNKKYEAKNSASLKIALDWIADFDKLIPDDESKNDEQYYSIKTFLVVVAHKMIDAKVAKNYLSSDSPVIRAAAYATLFNTKRANLFKDNGSTIKNFISEYKHDAQAIVRGLTISSNFWKTLGAWMKSQQKIFSFEELFLETGLKSDKDFISSSFVFCREMFISDSELDSYFDEDVKPFVNPALFSENDSQSLTDSRWSNLGSILTEQNKKIKWILWIAIALLLIVINKLL